VKPGIYAIDSDMYHSSSVSDNVCLSNSIANIMLRQSPYHAWMAHPKLNPLAVHKESSRFDLGTAAHDLILEGGTAKICVINPEDYRSKPTKTDPEGAIPKGWTNNAIKAARDEARSNGLVPLLPWDSAVINSMVIEAQEFIEKSALKGIFQRGKAEESAFWEDRGVHCKARLDWLTDDREFILDYKTTDSAHPEAFIRQIGRMGYDLQSAFYSRGIDVLTGKRPRFVFLAQEIEAPYSCSLIGLDAAYEEIAAGRYIMALDQWKACLEANNWPAYASEIHFASPPAWLMQQHEEAMFNGGSQ